MALADRIAVMSAGRFLQVARPEDIHDRPASETVARFIGRSAVLSGRVEQGIDGSFADLGPLCLPLETTDRRGPGQVVIRPGDVVLGEGVPARLEDAFYRGGQWEALARVGGLAAPLPVVSSRGLSEGEMVQVAPRRGWLLPG